MIRHAFALGFLAFSQVAFAADLAVTKMDTPDPVPPGGNITYDITVTNAGPDDADFVNLDDTLPAGTTFLSLTPEPGWSCTTPAIGSGGMVSCSNPLLANGSAAGFSLTVAVDSGATPGTVITNTATVSAETSDPSPDNNSGSADTTVAAPPNTADLSVTKVDDPDPVTAGANLVYTITVTNGGPSDATSVNLVDPLPPETTFVSLSSPGGWSCTTPAVGTNDSVLCSIASLPPGSAVFTLTVAVGAGTAAGTQVFNTATLSSANDPDEGNNSGSATTTVFDPTAVALTKSDFPDPVTAGTGLTYFITATNSSGADLGSATLTDVLPAGTTFDSFGGPVPAGWSCTTPPVGSGGTISCTATPFPQGGANFTVNVQVNASLPAGTVLTNTAHLAVTDGATTTTKDATTTTTVITPPAISATKSVTGSFTPGGAVTYTVVLTNLGPGNQGDNPGPEFSDVLPPELTLVSATATAGTAVATVATNTVTWNGSLTAGGGSVTITINATINPGVPPGTTISNQGQVFFDFNGDGVNESSTVTDNPATPGPDATSFTVTQQQAIGEIPTLDTLGLVLLALLLAAAGAWRMRRRQA